MFTVHGNATQVAAIGGLINGVIYELQGSTFESRAAPGLPQMNVIFLRPDGTGVAVGVAGAMAFRDASGWQLQQPGLNTILDLHGTWSDPDGGVGRSEAISPLVLVLVSTKAWWCMPAQRRSVTPSLTRREHGLSGRPASTESGEAKNEKRRGSCTVGGSGALAKLIGGNWICN